ncbi:MAG: hypothetical protein IJI14_17470 [Anaerolineaceae bacterium]|nr:hypothetical protein [Anaerolineaceae bacterium]
MRKTTSLISILLICSLLLSAFAPFIQEGDLANPDTAIVDTVQSEPDNQGNGEDVSNQVVVGTPAQDNQENQVPAVNTEPSVDNGESEGTDQGSDIQIPVYDDQTPANDNQSSTEDPVNGNNPEIVNPDNSNTASGQASGDTENSGETIETPQENQNDGTGENTVSPEGQEADADSTAQIPVLNVTEFIHKQNTSDFRIIVSNMGSIVFSNVTLKANKPTITLNGSVDSSEIPGAFVSVNSVPVEVEGSEYIIGDMEPGAVVELVYHTDIPEGFSSAVVNSSVEVKGGYITVGEEGEKTETITGSSSASSYIVGENPHFADIGVSLVDSKDGFYFPGESILHQVVVSNTSEFDMDNVSVSYNGLSAFGYEEIPCVFTRVCGVNGCAAIPTETQDSNYNLGRLGSADSSNHSVVLFCENGVNNAYSENVSYTGHVNVSANVLANDLIAPANSTANATSETVTVEVMVPMTLSVAPVTSQLDSDDETGTESDDTASTLSTVPSLAVPTMRLMGARNINNLQSTGGGDDQQGTENNNTQGSTDNNATRGNSTLILRADCVHTGCIANTDTTKSFYVSVCNDGSESYESVVLSAVNQSGSFSRYFQIGIGSYSGSGGYSESGAVSASGTSVNTGALPGNKCVVAVFDATFNDPPQDHTQSKSFVFSVNADGQTGDVTVSVDGCYVPAQSAGIEISVNPISECVNPDATSVAYTVQADNTGTADLCNVTITANKSGTFTGRNETTTGPMYTQSELYGEDFVKVTFNEDLSGVTLNEGGTHNIVFTVTGTQCNVSGASPITSSTQTSFEVCVPERPSLNITPPAITVCQEPNEGMNVSFTVENTGNVDFCNLKGTIGVKQGGTVVSSNQINNLTLVKGRTTNISFEANPATLNFNTDQPIEFFINIDGYTALNGVCQSTPAASASSTADNEFCQYTPSFVVTPPSSDTCQEMDEPETFDFTIKNDGEVSFCEITGVFRVEKDGQTIDTKNVTISNGLAVGQSVTAQYTANPETLGLQPGDEYTVYLVTTVYTEKNGQCTETPLQPDESSVDKTLCEEPSIVVTPPNPGECHDMDEPETLEFTVKNDGTVEFCKVEGVFRVEKEGQTIDTKTVQIAANLAVGSSVVAQYIVNPEELGLESGDEYSVHLVTTVYTEKDGICDQTPLEPVDSYVDKKLCENEPSIVVTPPDPGECHEMDEPETVTFPVLNNGSADFCRVDGTIYVIAGGSTVAEYPFTIAEGLAKGDTTDVTQVIDTEEIGLTPGSSYKVKIEVNGYVSTGGECPDEPASTDEGEVEKTICERLIPSITVGTETVDKCLKMSEPEDVVFEITNDGTADFCRIDGIVTVKVKNKTVGTANVTLDALAAGESTEFVYTVDHEALGISAGETYRVTLTLKPYVEVDGECSETPLDPVEITAERTLCEDVKPVLNIINLNPACIDAGDTLKFKGEINIDENSAANTIEVTTGTINWGGSEYQCKITSVKENTEDGYRILDEGDQGTTWEYEVTERGEGVIGFICEAETNPNEQMRNGRQLKFDATAKVSVLRDEYTIRSNRIVDTQKCVVTRAVRLPRTGDDTNLPLMVGLFSLFVITGAFASIKIFRKKNPGTDGK